LLADIETEPFPRKYLLKLALLAPEAGADR
jgi:hypothetical protein